MKNIKLMKITFLAIFLISIFGAVICFPLKLNSGDTCLLHHFLHGANHGHLSKYASDDVLLNRYLKPFAFIWWISLAGIIFSVYKLRKM